MPCFGAKIKVIINNTVVVKTITAPDDKMCTKLKYRPITAENDPKSEDNIIMNHNQLVNKDAVDAGVISMATTRTTPTVCREETVTIDTKTIMTECIKRAGK